MLPLANFAKATLNLSTNRCCCERGEGGEGVFFMSLRLEAWDVLEEVVEVGIC